MMQTLRNAFRLLRRHPSLAVPVLIADLLHFATLILESLARHNILLAWATRREAVHSVLLGTGDAPRFLPSPSVMEAFAAISRMAGVFLGAFFYVAALYATLRMMQRLSERNISFRPWPINASIRLTCWVVGIGMVVVAILLIALRMPPQYGRLLAWLVRAEAVIQLLLCSWFVAPHALRFLAERCGRPVATNHGLQARVFSALMVGFSTALLYATNPLLKRAFSGSEDGSVFMITAARALQSMGTALPFCLLFVSLVLLVYVPDEVVADTE